MVYPFLLWPGQISDRKVFVVRGSALLFVHDEKIVFTIHDSLAVFVKLFPFLRTMNQPAAKSRHTAAEFLSVQSLDQGVGRGPRLVSSSLASLAATVRRSPCLAFLSHCYYI